MKTALFVVVAAWDKVGHEAVGMTAMSALSPVAVTAIKHLMRGKDVADVAAWAHKVNEKFPWTSALHFQTQPDNQCSVSVTGDNCEGNLCLLPALKYFFAHLTGDTGPELKLKGGVKFTDADALKYLINLIGDLHQPMHLGFQSHKSGKEIQVEYRGKTMDLFTFMDSGIAAEVLQNENQFWWSGWTNVREERAEYAEDQATWKRLGADSFDKWANETARIVCDSVENRPTSKTPLGKRGDKVHVDRSLYEAWRRDVVLKQILRAGGRLAIVLNGILDTRKAKLKEGTAHEDLEEKLPTEEEDEEVATRKAKKAAAMMEPWKAFLCNATLFLVIWSIFFWAVEQQAKYGPVHTHDSSAEAESGPGLFEMVRKSSAAKSI
jgi:hypothetical protein